MKKYRVRFNVLLPYDVIVEAKSIEEATEHVRDRYSDTEIIVVEEIKKARKRRTK